MEVGAQTSLYGILGHPVRHSLSPRIHNRAFQAEGLDAVYLAFDVEPGELTFAIEGLRALGARGFNLTVPHKEAAIPLLDELAASALAAGAVNVVVRDGRRFVGHNTDAAGFLASLGDFSPTGRRVLVLGTGGAARAVALALASRVAEVVFAGRDPGRREELVEAFAGQGALVRAVPWERREEVEGIDLLVNATPLGLKGEGTPFSAWERVSPAGMVVDLVYNPPETAFLKAARLAGRRGVNGLEMLYRQAELAWEIWFGRRGPVEIFREVHPDG